MGTAATGNAMHEPITWLNPPTSWHFTADGLALSTDQQTDFWRKTEYGFIRDNGHFAYRTITGDFSAEVTFSADYQVLYDQAGLMLAPYPYALRAESVRVRLSRRQATVSTAFRRADGSWQLARVAGFPADGDGQLGVMCCSPQRAGLNVRFADFSVAPLAAVDRPQVVTPR